MNNEFVFQVIRRNNLRLLFSCLAVLVVLGLVLLLNMRYLYNFFLGPFSLNQQEIQSAGDESSPLRYYVTLRGDQTLDTGYQWISENDSGKQTIEATYSVMVLDDRLLVVKVDSGDPERLEFTGALVPMPEDVRTEILADAEGQVPGITQAFFPLMLDTKNFRGMGVVGLVVGAAILLGCAWFLFVWLQRTVDPASHPIAKSLSRLGPLEAISTQIEMEMQSEHPKIGAVHFTRSQLIEARPAALQVVPYRDISWIYKYVVQRRTNGVPTGKTYSAVIWDRFGGKLTIAGKEKDVDAVLDGAIQRAPWAIPGYQEHLAREWTRNRAGVLAIVEQRRATIGTA